MTEKEFLTEININNIEISSTQLELFKKYCNFLIEYNKHTNLTAIKTEKEIYLKHFYDSILLINNYKFNDEQKVLDIGTGAGFPGVVLKIMLPNIKLTLLDSNNKKTTFIKALLEVLEISDVEVVNDRAEKYCDNNREIFDVVTSRAVTQLNVLAELSIPLLKVGGIFLPMKGNVIKELEEAKQGIEMLGAEVIKVNNYELPIENSIRSVVIIKKMKPTSNLYPRTYDKIIKKPL